MWLLPLTLLAAAHADVTEWCAVQKSLVVGPTEDADWRALLRNDEGAADRLVDFVESQHITRVYVYVGALDTEWEDFYARGALPEGDSLSTLVARLWGVGAEPVALWSLGEGDYSQRDRAFDLIAAVDAFNANWYPYPFIGVQAGFAPTDPDLYDEHINLLADLRNDRASLTWPMEYSARLPTEWLTETWGDAPLYESALAAVDHATYDGWTDDRFRMIERGATFLTTADAAVISGELGVLVTADGNPNQTWYEESLEDPLQVYEELVKVDEGLLTFVQYAGIGITDYAGFFAATHGGLRPQDHTGIVDGPCLEDPSEDTGEVEVETEDTALQTEVPDAYPAPDYVRSEGAEDRELIGCGCAAGGPGSSLGGLAGLALLAAARRRRP
jgi:MYXO-CTERM domain-containing protein